MKIGIPRSLYYFYYKDLWINFFKYLNIEIIISPKTTKQILELGMKYSTDEMCLSVKDYVGHIMYLKDRCDYILIPRVDNYGRYNQTCTNFLALYDICNNLIDTKILNYNINLMSNESEELGLIKICKEINIGSSLAKKAYKYAKEKEKEAKHFDVLDNIHRLSSRKTKILLVAHDYNTYNNLIGEPIIKLIKNLDTEIIYSNLFSNSQNFTRYSQNLYWKYSKDSLNGICEYIKYVDGIIFLSSFPCGLDSLVNELIMRKIDKPYINIVVDDVETFGGIETRIESFIDIIKIKANKQNS